MFVLVIKRSTRVPDSTAGVCDWLRCLSAVAAIVNLCIRTHSPSRTKAIVSNILKIFAVTKVAVPGHTIHVNTIKTGFFFPLDSLWKRCNYVVVYIEVKNTPPDTVRVGKWINSRSTGDKWTLKHYCCCLMLQSKTLLFLYGCFIVIV